MRFLRKQNENGNNIKTETTMWKGAKETYAPADTSAKRQRLHKEAAPTLTVFGKMGAYSEAMLTPPAPS